MSLPIFCHLPVLRSLPSLFHEHVVVVGLFLFLEAPRRCGNTCNWTAGTLLLLLSKMRDKVRKQNVLLKSELLHRVVHALPPFLPILPRRHTAGGVGSVSGCGGRLGSLLAKGLFGLAFHARNDGAPHV